MTDTPTPETDTQRQNARANEPQRQNARANEPQRRHPHADVARRWHDMGGNAAGPIEGLGGPDDQHDFSMWEKRVDALMVIGSAKGYFTVDGLRRVLEDMGVEAFETMTYYERWIASINQNLIEGGAYTTADLAAKMAEVTARGDTYGDATKAG